MEIVQVADQRSVNEFHLLPIRLYSNDVNWVGPLRMMIEDIFSREKNAGFMQGDARRWIVQHAGTTIGRIAAFYDRSNGSTHEQPTGGIGFFECEDNQDAANLLFDTARDWLKSEGFEAMEGPINFGETFFHWGLLVDGFTQQSFGMPYNPEWYGRLFRSYGFETYYRQLSYHLDVTSPDLPERFWKIAARVGQNPEFTFQTFSFKEQERCIADFLKIHEEAWNKHSNYKPVKAEDLRVLIKESKHMLDEEFIWYVYHNGEPVAFFMMIPDFNQILKHFKSGKLNLFSVIKLLYLKRKKVINRCRVLVMGVVPRFQKRGLESGIFWHLRQVMLRRPWYREMELSWVGDFNPKMIALFDAVGGHHAKTHETLCYLFDRTKPFSRLPIIED